MECGALLRWWLLTRFSRVDCTKRSLYSASVITLVQTFRLLTSPVNNSRSCAWHRRISCTHEEPYTARRSSHVMSLWWACDRPPTARESCEVAQAKRMHPAPARDIWETSKEPLTCGPGTCAAWPYLALSRFVCTMREHDLALVFACCTLFHFLEGTRPKWAVSERPSSFNCNVFGKHQA